MGKGRIPRDKDLKRREEAAKRKPKKDPKAHKQVPRTLENSRHTGALAEVPDQVTLDEAFKNDEFASYFEGKTVPKILVTTVRRASKKCYLFAEELAGVFFGASVHTRPTNTMLGDVLKEAKLGCFTDVIIIGQRLKEPFSLTMIHLPNGPTMTFRLRSVRTAKSLRNHGNPTEHPPELIMNHFTSLLGATVGRFLMSLFPPVPQFSGRQAVTFHHQRDFIFFRRHRYIFQEVKNELENAEDETSSETATTVAVKPTKMTVTDKVRLQEIGPRFTLKLLLVQKGLPTNVDAPILWQRKKNLSTRASIHL